jgi:hypothetical protein
LQSSILSGFCNNKSQEFRALYVAHTMQKQTLQRSTTVRGALVWLGRPDPALSMEQARQDDPELGELRDVMTQWIRHIGLNVEAPAKTLLHKAELRQRDDETGRQLQELAYPDLRDALAAVAGGRGGIDAARFGRWMRGKKGRVVTLELPNSRRERVRFETRGETGGAARWCLVIAPEKGG